MTARGRRGGMPAPRPDRLRLSRRALRNERPQDVPFAAVHESGCGTTRTSGDVRC